MRSVSHAADLEIPGLALELGAKTRLFLERRLGFFQLFAEALLELGQLVDLRLGLLDQAAVFGDLGLRSSLDRVQFDDLARRLLQLGVQLRQLRLQLLRLLLRIALHTAPVS